MYAARTKSHLSSYPINHHHNQQQHQDNVPSQVNPQSTHVQVDADFVGLTAEEAPG